MSKPKQEILPGGIINQPGSSDYWGKGRKKRVINGKVSKF